MAKLTRVTQLVFGKNGNSSHFGQFGSKAAGSPVQTLDPASIQSLPAFTGDGWLNAVVNANKQPFLEDMNGLFRLVFYQIAQMLQDGIPEWDAGTPYYIGSIVRKVGTFEQYGSLTNDNTGNALPSQTSNGNWQYLNPASVAPGVMTDFGGSSAPFGWLLCDGTSYATASYPALFSAIGYGWGGSGANFNVPDLRGRTAVGTGGTLNLTLAQAFGEVSHVLSIAEMPSHDHDIIDPGHTHISSRAIGASGSGGSAMLAPPQDNGHPLSTASATTGVAVGNRGGNGAHNNVQPSSGVTKIIKI